MKLTVVGCWGGYPAKDGATSCYLLEKDGFVLAIDMGSGALAKLQHYYSVMDLDAVILSHYHHDHMADIGVLQYARLTQFYVTGKDTILPIYGHLEDEEGFAKLTHQFTKGEVYEPDKTLTLGPFSITFLKTAHPVPCYGMRITDGETSLVYTADTAFQTEWIPFAENADLLITDCNFFADQDGSVAGHMTSKEAATIAQKANVGHLLLSHLPQYGDLQQLCTEASEFYQGTIDLATTGFVRENEK